jgi:hypothetical protein
MCGQRRKRCSLDAPSSKPQPVLRAPRRTAARLRTRVPRHPQRVPLGLRAAQRAAACAGIRRGHDGGGTLCGLPRLLPLVPTDTTRSTATAARNSPRGTLQTRPCAPGTAATGLPRPQGRLDGRQSHGRHLLGHGSVRSRARGRHAGPAISLPAGGVPARDPRGAPGKACADSTSLFASEVDSESGRHPQRGRIEMVIVRRAGPRKTHMPPTTIPMPPSISGNCRAKSRGRRPHWSMGTRSAIAM